MLHEEVELVALNSINLNVIHAGCIVFKEISYSCKVSISKVVLYLMKEVFLNNLTGPVILLVFLTEVK